MRTRVLNNTIAMLIGSATTALAASGAREDNSGFFVWIFLGFCALIVAAQLLPAILLALGGVKGLRKAKEEEAQTVAH